MLLAHYQLPFEILYYGTKMNNQQYRKESSIEGIISFICCSAIQDNPESQQLWVGISIAKKLSRVDYYQQSTLLKEISIQSICPISTIQVFR